MIFMNEPVQLCFVDALKFFGRLYNAVPCLETMVSQKRV